MEKIPENLEVSYLEVIIMPNGEVITLGKTIGWFDNLRNYLHKKP